MKRHTLIATLLLAFTSMTAQPRMDFNTKEIHVGDIVFQQPKTVTFTFQNTGSQALYIQEVIAACDCAQATWNRNGIEPGAKGEISMTYDASFLGTFHKELEVYSNATKEPVYLVMSGRVTTSVTYDIDNFPVDLGNIRLSKNVVEFDDINIGDTPEITLHVVNVSQDNYKPELMHLPSYLEAQFQPEELSKGRVGKINLRLHSDRLKEYGLTQTSIFMSRYPGDKVSNDNEIEVTALLLPAFAHLNAEELAQAPQMFLSEDSLTFDFSAVKNDKIWNRAYHWAKKVVTGKETITKRIIISNLGKTDLIFSSVQIYGKSLSISLSNKTIPAGGQGELSVTVNKNLLKKSKSQPRVLLIANDPHKPKTIIPIKIL